MIILRIFIALILFAAYPVWAAPALVAPLTSGNTPYLSGNVGTSPIVILAKDLTRGFLQIQNVSLNTNSLTCTIDGSTPSVGSNGITLGGVATGAGGSAFFDTFVPTGPVTCVGSSSGTAFTISYVP